MNLPRWVHRIRVHSGTGASALRRDPILWGALGCALVATAHAEYTLATATQMNWVVAGAVPGALDLYVIRALQQGRDVFLAVVVMVAANVTSHLITAKVINVDWYITGAVGALAPLILWRIYALKRTRNRPELLWGLDAGAVSAPAPEAPVAPTAAPAPWVPGYHLDGCDGLCGGDGPVACTFRAGQLERAPLEFACTDDPDEPLTRIGGASAPAAPRLHLVLTEDEWDALSDADLEYVDSAGLYLADCEASGRRPSNRALALWLGLKGGAGQERARRLLKHLAREAGQ